MPLAGWLAAKTRPGRKTPAVAKTRLDRTDAKAAVRQSLRPGSHLAATQRAMPSRSVRAATLVSAPIDPAPASPLSA
jgi:hypothetical protein